MRTIGRKQMSLLEHLVERGFTPVAFPLYGNAIGIRRGDFAALLVPTEDGGFGLLGGPHYLLNGNPSVRISQNEREWFVYKEARVEATSEMLAEMGRFADELRGLLTPAV